MDIEKIKVPKEILKKENVVGFSNNLHAKIDRRLKSREDSIRIYVTKKIPKAYLAEEDIIPEIIDGIKTDVVELGSEPNIFSSDEGHKEKLDSLIPGCSIGNFGITAGTLGWFAEKDGGVFLDSNAHIVCDYPHKSSAIEKRILQPGKIDGGAANDVVGYYKWHEPIKPNAPILDYPLSWWQKLLKRFGFLKEPEIPEGWIIPVNYYDYGVFTKLEDVPEEHRTIDFDVINQYSLTGKIFAGCLYYSIICKIGYQLEMGYNPLYVEVDDINRFDKLRKSGRTTGDTERYVMDESAAITVNYGYFKAFFDDVVLANKMSRGGDSGSSVWKALV